MAVDERTWRDDCVPERRRRVEPAPPSAAVDALRLQRSAGNHAVAGLLAGRRAGRASIQRTPSAWQSDQRVLAVLALKKGGALTSRWPKVHELTSAYGRLGDGDRAGRTSTLAALEAAVGAWKEHQQTAWVSNKQLVSDKQSALTALEQLIAAERQELSAARQQPPPAPPPTATSTASVSIPTPSRAIPPRPSTSEWSPDEDIFAMDSETEEEHTPAPRPSHSDTKAEEPEEPLPLPIDLPLDLPPLPVGIQVQVHFTKSDHLKSIRAEGLKPGKGEGIGDPETKKPDPHRIYVVDEHADATTVSAISGEAGGEAVVVLAGSPGSRDINYKAGAVTHQWNAPPVRTAAEAAEARARGYSFTLPMTPTTRTGMTAYINAQLGGKQVTEEVAEAMVLSKLVAMMPLHMRPYARPARPSEQTNRN